MELFWRDLRYGLRMMARNPGVTAIAVLSLAIGLCSNTVVFSLVNAFLFRPLPFREPARLVHVWETSRRESYDRSRVSIPDFLDWKQQSQAFEDLAVFNYTGENFSGGVEPERVPTGRVSANIFTVLGVQPFLGRGFLPGEDQPGSGQVVVLSYPFWRERFAASPAAIGQTVKLNGESYSIVGVMPPGFVFPLPITQLWAPRVLDRALHPRSDRYLQVLGRLKPGITREKAQAEMGAIASRLEAAYPVENAGVGVNVVPLRDALNFASDILTPMSAILAVAAGFVLLITCANVSNLLMAQAVARRKELAIRAALGSGRRRLIFQLLTESALLALLGGAAGALLARWIVVWMAATIPPQLYRVGEIAVDLQALGFTLALCFLTTALFGLVPALRAARCDPNESLKDAAEGSAPGFRRQRPLAVLVTCEIALSFVLLVSGALIVESVTKLQRVDLGFDSKSVLTMGLSLPREKYSQEKLGGFHRQMLQKVAELPQVDSAATVDMLPLNHEWDETPFDVEGRPTSSGDSPLALTLVVSPDYFRVLRIPLLAGRAFTAQDDRASAPGVIINDALAHRFFARENPIGRRLILKGDDGKNTAVSILGVVGATRHRDLAASSDLQIYRPQFENPARYFRVIVRTGSNPLALAAPVRSAIWSLDKDLSLVEIRTLDQVVSQFLLPQRSLAIALFAMAASALLLATVGIYGMMSFSVRRRTRELGIRRALGAQPGEVVRLVVAQGMRLTLIGLGAGLAISAVLTRFLANQLFGVGPGDVLTFAGVALLLAAVASLACYIPARRATLVDPMIALRHE